MYSLPQNTKVKEFELDLFLWFFFFLFLWFFPEQYSSFAGSIHIVS